ncbi:MAG: 2-oxoglutarate dehydrogenase E1 component [Candidatus Fonsibacter sp.]|jgi:2-oxoglutarate dehydrogenase E1 component|nr:2-oxoglutarate dehydrogenase E1 component [Candidatus Fonsibacter sp.]
MSSQENNIIFEKTSFLSGTNSSYIEKLYAKYVEDPTSIPDSWRQFFEGLGDQKDNIIENQGPSWAPSNIKYISNGNLDVYEKYLPKNLNGNSIKEKIVEKNRTLSSDEKFDVERSTIDSVRAIMMIRAYRIRGHLIADLDPLQLQEKHHHPELNPETYGFKKEDRNRKIFLDKFLGLEYATVNEILEILLKTYCSKIGIEFMHMSDPEEKKWIQERIEGKGKEANFTSEGKKAIFKKLVEAEGFENYCHTKFVGTKRFGLDGCESLIPALEQIIKVGGGLGVKEVKIGMPHRGRLNILANVIQKPFKKIFKEFSGDPGPDTAGVSGDVKYHLGASADRDFNGNNVHVSLTANPSHLEAVNPVVLGQTRAKQFFHNDPQRVKVVPILLHGDAAFAGQGIVAECFAMSGLKGHNTGGTIHIIVNNQIGFTTSPSFARSSPYPSEVAKMVQAPIFHVNGDDAESVVYCARIATEYRQKFKRDVVIDIICYRRFGHNEGDEPSFTQPLMYKKIRAQATTLTIYGNQLIQEGVLSKEEFQNEKDNFKKFLDTEFETSKSYIPNQIDWFTGSWSKFTTEIGSDRRGVTGVDLDLIHKAGEKICNLPANLNSHSTIKRLFEAKKKMFETGKGFDWATAESLAFGTLLLEGYPVRFVGQDSSRGTFSQRHASVLDQDTGEKYYPLKNLSSNQGQFEIIDSFLSEFGVLGFEYGYSLSSPETLVLWEAQFGDFANGAQIIIDQFITSGEKKWTRASGLVMLLPHGYEGQGPEHSSARIERYLQSCAQENLQVVNCTTPANYFHLLRRQIHRTFRKPLIVFSPKSLLRHKKCVSEIEDFLPENSFHRILPDHADFPEYNLIKLAKDEDIKRVVLCSGKVYFDISEKRETIRNPKVQLLRIEQLYPFPVKKLASFLKRFKNADEFIWCQEEPENMGAWSFVEKYINWTLDLVGAKSKKVQYVGRKPSASTATGYLKKHVQQQDEIISKVLL